MARSKKDQQGLMLIAGVSLALLAIFAFKVVISQKPKPDEHGCIGQVDAKLAFVIDSSDAIPSQTADEIKRRVVNYVEQNAAPNTLVSIFRIDENSRSNLKPIFTGCKLEETGNDLYQNSKHIAKKFHDNFEKPLQEAVMSAPKVSEKSPIGEVLSDLALTGYLDGKKNDLVVFSDLLQNSDNTSIYQCTDPKAAIAAYSARRSGAVGRPSFKNVAVQLDIVPREGIGQATVACRDGFWRWYFGDDEGPNAALDVKNLPGGVAL